MSSNAIEEHSLSLDTVASDLLNEQKEPNIIPTSSDTMSPMTLNSDIKLSDDEKLFEIDKKFVSTPVPKSMLSPLHRVQISDTFKPGLEAFSGSISVSQTLSIHRQIDKKYQQTIYSSDDTENPFELIDVLSNMQSSMSSILENDFSLCFNRPEHRPWNWNYFLFFFWAIGVFIRYCVLFPLRLMIYCSALTLTSVQFWVLRKIFRNDAQKRKEWELSVIRTLATITICTWGGVIEYKGVFPKRKPNQIFVCNHTTMVDWLVLMYYHPFCVVGQLHSSRPFVKWIQSELLECLDCLWFDRAEQKDRNLIMKRMKEHIADTANARLLIFPEGTCVNNQYCVQFKKGAFALECEVCPIAIKYNSSFMDAYWISKNRSFPMHLCDIMCSWLFVVEVYLLEPQTKRVNESTIEFAARVQKMIADAAQLKNTNWNGYFKHYKPSQKTVDAKKTVITNKMDRFYDALFVENEELSANADFSCKGSGEMLPTIEESVLRHRVVS